MSRQHGAAALLLAALVAAPALHGASAALEASTNGPVYAPGHPLQVFGTGLPGENLVVRLFAPDDTIAKFDQLAAGEDGSFSYQLMVWPEPSARLPYGTYTVEVISTEQDGASSRIDVKFAPTSELEGVPVERSLSALVFAPESSAVDRPVRVFVQVTSDGLLIGNDPAELLRTSHVHLPSGRSVPLSGQFDTLHQGLYYADYVPDEEGTHVFHVVAFHQGGTSHGSAATSVLSQDIGGISDQILALNTILAETSGELDTLESEITGFDATLVRASAQIDETIGNIGEASSQLNALLLPIIASIGLIVALQITILARGR
ncbi:conserved exported hypothetical protein [Nitrosopumilaceae archaeon]|nr:conserved exported hypothetical protein [Nitrosopumilaceae archaeon]